MEYDILIRDVMLLNSAFAVEQHMAVAVTGNSIAAVGPAKDFSGIAARQVIEGKGKLCMPGLVDAHMHACQQLLRGSLADEYPMIWLRFLVPFESTLTEEDVYYSALLCCIQEIKAGTTTFADSGGRHMHRVAQAVAESGIRASLSRSMIDMGDEIPPGMRETAQEALAQNEAFYKAWHGAADGRISVFFGMRQVLACSPELIEQVGDKARTYNTGVHAHLCEHRDEVSYCLKNYRLRPAEYLDKLGLLGPNLLTAHAVALSGPDITLMAERGVKVVHCPTANFTYHGFPKTPRMLEAGITVGLGSDGAAFTNIDIFEEMRMLRAGIQASQGLPVFDPMVLPVRQVLHMATMGGADALGLGGMTGSVEVGKRADLITLNINQPHLCPSNNYATTIVDCIGAQDVADSIIDGTIVMRDRKLLTLDEEAVMRECGDRMRSIAQRAYAGKHQ